jgi:hypothetical protein
MVLKAVAGLEKLIPSWGITIKDLRMFGAQWAVDVAKAAGDVRTPGQAADLMTLALRHEGSPVCADAEPLVLDDELLAELIEEKTPVEDAPVEAAPVGATPVEAAPVEAAPVEVPAATTAQSKPTRRRTYRPTRDYYSLVNDPMMATSAKLSAASVPMREAVKSLLDMPPADAEVIIAMIARLRSVNHST